MSTASARAVVIGAGVIGSAVGLELARRGFTTTIVDRGAAPGHGSTAASSAVVRFNYSTLAGTVMSYEAAEWWRTWADHVRLPAATPLTRFVQCGVAMYDDPKGLVRSTLEHLRTAAVRHEWWSREELAERLPFVSTGSWFPPRWIDDPAFMDDPSGDLGGAVFTPEAGYVSDPQLAAQNLADAAVRAGATLRLRAEVVGVEHVGGRVTGIRLADGAVLSADVVVNVAGPHSDRVNRLAGAHADMAVGLRPLRQQVAHVRVPESLAGSLSRLPATADLDGGIYFRPDTEAILAGGVEADCDPLHWLDDPDAVDLDVDADEWEAHVMRLARRIPELGVPHERRAVVGVYDVADDWMPVLDRSCIDGWYMAVGTSGNQFKNAPIIGHCMAELIEAVERGHDHDRDPVVIRGPRRGGAIPLGEFSRLRRSGEDARSRGVLG